MKGYRDLERKNWTLHNWTAITKNNISLVLKTKSRRLDPTVAEMGGVDAVLADLSKGFYVIGDYAGRIFGQ